MKITWFSTMTFRIHIAGRILVTDPEGAGQGIEPSELVSGAGTIIAPQSVDLADFDPARWTPRKRARLIDTETGDEGLNLYRLGTNGLIADSREEGLLVLDHAGSQTQWNRWADGAVVVLSGTGAQCAAHGNALLDIARPRFIALAVTDGEIDAAFDALVPRLADASLIVVEPGLAVEV